MFERATVAAAVGVAESGTSGESGTSPGDGFAAPDLISTNLNSATGNSGLNVGEVFPQTGGGAYVLASAAGGVSGSRCLHIFAPPGSSDLFYPVGIGWTRRNAVYVRTKFRIPSGNAPNGNFKGLRFHDTGGPGNNGEFYGGDPSWAFDWDGDQSLLSLGLYYGNQPAEEASYGVINYGDNLDDDVFHALEIFYDRNVAGGFVEVSFWFDGVPIVQPTGPCFASFYSPTFEHPFSSWIGGSAGVSPSRIRCARSGTGGTFLEDFTVMETVSSGEGEVFWDDLAASTQRIGPT